MPTFDEPVDIQNVNNASVGSLRANESTVLEDYPASARFFGELELSRPDLPQPSVRASGLAGSLTLGVKSALDGVLRLYGDHGPSAGTVMMSGGRLVLSAGHVAASALLESVKCVARDLLLEDDAGTTRVEWRRTTGQGQVSDTQGQLRYELDSNSGRSRFFDGNGTMRHEFDSTTGRARFFDASGNGTLTLDGQVGDVVLNNADCAEEFPVDPESDTPIPGHVVVLCGGGRVRPGAQAQDTRVAGVVSGAGRYRPGLLLDRQPDSTATRVPVALMGKVDCFVDATERPVRAGDLLTTAEEPGHAAVLPDSSPAPGAVLGKALSDLPSGRGLVPVLVTLQ